MQYQELSHYLITLGKAYKPADLHVVDTNISSMVAEQLSQIQYPAMMIESPELYMDSTDVDHTPKIKATLAFAIIANNTNKENHELRQYNLNTTLNILQDLILQIIKHAQERKCICPGVSFVRSRIDQIKSRTSDAYEGWRVEFDLTKFIKGDISDKFEDLDYSILKFNYDDNIAEFPGATLGAWKLYVEGQEQNISTGLMSSVDLSGIATGAKVYIEVTVGTQSRKASAKFIKGESGTSIPLTYNPY